MNTALQELIEYLKETYTETIGEPAIKKAQSLLPKEKEDIMNAYTKGYTDLGKRLEHNDNYFSNTFNQ